MEKNEELLKRIREVSDGAGLPRMEKKDYVIAMIFAGVCLLGIILGGVFL